MKKWLIAKGYTQSYGVDYFEIFSLVTRLHSVRILLSVAVVKQWSLYQLDIKNTCLQENLQEKVYMLQPLGYKIQRETRTANSKKKIYGLKQSPRTWFDKSVLLLRTMN